MSAEALGLLGPTSSHLEGLASCFAINFVSFFFLARCQAVSVDDPAGAMDEAPQHQRIM